MPFEPIDPLGGFTATDELPKPQESVLPDPTTSETFGAAFRTDNTIGSLFASEDAHFAGTRIDSDFDPWGAIAGTPYEPYYENFARAANKEHFEAIKSDIDRENKDRDIMGRSGWTGLGASLVAGTVDWPIIIPGGQVVRSAKGGVSLLKTALSTGVAGGIAGAASEVMLQNTQQLRTAEESAMVIGGSAVLSGILGAGIGKLVARSDFDALAPRIERDLTVPGVDKPDHFEPGSFGAKVEAAPGASAQATAIADALRQTASEILPPQVRVQVVDSLGPVGDDGLYAIRAADDADDIERRLMETRERLLREEWEAADRIRKEADEADAKVRMSGEARAKILAANDTPEFASWFSGSKTVEADGKPQILFHGTSGDIQAFDPMRANSNTQTGVPEGTFFFSSSPRNAATYAGADGGNVMPVFVALKDPFIVDAGGKSWLNIVIQNRHFDTNELSALARDQGFDGVIVRNVRDSSEGSVVGDTVIAFKPEQIKSAIGNRGTFDPADARIAYGVRSTPSGPIAEGRFDPNKLLITIAADALDPLKTLHHESIHALKQMGLFTAKEWQTLEAAAKKRGWIESTNVRALYEGLYSGRVPLRPDAGQVESPSVKLTNQGGPPQGKQLVVAKSGVPQVRNVADFRSAVDELKSKLNVTTRPRRELPDQGKFSLRSLPAMVSELKQGSRLKLVADHVRGFKHDTQAIIDVAEQHVNLDIAQMPIADREVFLDSLSDLQQIVQDRLQLGYTVAEEIDEVSEHIDGAFDKTLDDIVNIKDDAQAALDDMSDHVDELESIIALREAAGDQSAIARSAARDAEEANLPEESWQEASARVRRAIAPYEMPDYSEQASILDVGILEVERLRKIVADVRAKLDEVRGSDIVGRSAAELEDLQVAAGDVVGPADIVRRWTDELESVLLKKHQEALDNLNRIKEELVQPDLKRMEDLADEIEERIVEIEDGLRPQAAKFSLRGEGKAVRDGGDYERVQSQLEAIFDRWTDPLEDIPGRWDDRDPYSLPSLRKASEQIIDDIKRAEGIDARLDEIERIKDGMDDSQMAAYDRLTDEAESLSSDVGGIYEKWGASDSLPSLRARQKRLMRDLDRAEALVPRFNELNVPDDELFSLRGNGTAPAGAQSSLDPKLESLLIEEAIAEQFSLWRQGASKITGVIAKLFERMQQFLERTGNALRGRGFQTADDVFEAIGGGDVAMRVPGARVAPSLTTTPGMGRGASVGAAARDRADDALKSAFGMEKAMSFQDPMLRLQTSPSPVSNRHVQELAETPLTYGKNVLGEETAPLGTELGAPGAVESRVKIWTGALADAVESVDEQWLRYRQAWGKNNLGKRRALTLRDTLFGSEALTHKQFKAEVSKSLRRKDTHTIPEVAAAAREVRQKLLDPLKDEAIRAKLLPEGVTVETAESYLMRLYNKDLIIAERDQFKKVVADWLTETEAKASARRARLSKLVDQAEEAEAGGNKDEAAFWREEIEKELGAAKFGTRVDEDGPAPKPKGPKAILNAARKIIDEVEREPGEIDDLADQIIDRIIGTPDGRLPYDADLDVKTIGPMQVTVRGPLAPRDFMIPDAAIERWLENDIETIMRAYTRTMAPDVEIAKRFGSVDMKMQMKEIQEDYARRSAAAKTPAERKKINKQRVADIRDLGAIRDRIRGTYALPSNPDGYLVRTGRVVSSLNYMRMLGGMTLSAIPDIGGIVLHHGVMNTVGDGIIPLFRNWSGARLARGEVKRAGTALEMVLDSRAMSMADIMDDHGRHTKFERGVQAAARNFGVVSLQSQWNSGLKQFTGLVTMTRMLRAAESVASGKIKPRELERLAAAGISQSNARKIAEQFAKHGRKEGGVWFANTAQWDAGSRPAIDAFRVALVRDVDRIIITPGQDRPLWMSTEMGRLIGQFKSFSIAAMQRIVIAGLQQRDMGTLNGIILMTALGGLVGILKAKVAGQPVHSEWSDKKKNAQFLVEAIDRSGLTGWLMEVNSMTEKMSGGAIGLSAVTGKPVSRYAQRNITSSILGPSIGTIEDAYRVTKKAAQREWTQSDSRVMRRLIPYNNIFYARAMFDKAEAGINGFFGVPKPAGAR